MSKIVEGKKHEDIETIMNEADAYLNEYIQRKKSLDAKIKTDKDFGIPYNFVALNALTFLTKALKSYVIYYLTLDISEEAAKNLTMYNDITGNEEPLYKEGTKIMGKKKEIALEKIEDCINKKNSIMHYVNMAQEVNKSINKDNPNRDFSVSRKLKFFSMIEVTFPDNIDVFKKAVDEVISSKHNNDPNPNGYLN